MLFRQDDSETVKWIFTLPIIIGTPFELSFYYDSTSTENSFVPWIRCFFSKTIVIRWTYCVAEYIMQIISKPQSSKNTTDNYKS